MKFDLLDACQNWMLGIAKIREADVKFPLFNVHGSTKMEEKVRIWGSIKEKVDQLEHNKLILGGDFNAILDLNKNKAMLDFRKFINNMHL